jgi:hypothetical protein
MYVRLGLPLLLMSLVGCEATVSERDLGTVVFEIPKVAGADEPYPMPQLGPPAEPNHGNPGRRGLP